MFSLRSGTKSQQVQVDVSPRTVVRILLVISVWIIVLAAARRASHAVLLLFTAFFLALVLNAPVHWLAGHLPGKRRGSRSLATAISFLMIVILLGSFLGSIVPPLVRQTSNFIHAAPHLVESVRDQNSSLGHFIQTHHLESQVNKFSAQLGDRLNNVTGSAVSTVTEITSSIFSLLAILVLTFMMLIEGPHWLGLIERLLPSDQTKHVKRLVDEMYKVIRGYANGQLLLAALVAVLIVVPLLIMNVSYPIALMVVVFICGLIPLVGHIIGAVIVTLVTLFHSPVDAAIILAYYILYMQIEAYVIQPRVQANSTNMSPLLVFSSVLIGVSFGGIFGGLVAIPVAGCIRVLVVDYVERRKLLHGSGVPAATAETK